MPNFQYTGMNNNGQRVTGSIEALDSKEAATQLQSQYITPIAIQKTTGGSSASLAEKDIDINEWLSSLQSVDLEELIIFSRQMAALLSAGIPIIKAIKGLATSLENPRLKKALNNIADSLNGGSPLASAMKNHSDIFTPFMINMIHMGETTGRLDQTFQELAVYIEFERETKKRITSATRYPSMVVGALMIALLVINVWVIPAFSSVFAKLGADLPLPTKILMATSDFILTNGWFLACGLVIAFFAFKKWRKTEEGEYQWDRFLLKVPVIGKVFRLIALSRFCRTLATLIDAGVPVLQSLTVVTNTVNNAYVSRKISKMHSTIESGTSLSVTAAQTGLFTPLVLQMFVIGEETGAIDKLLFDVAHFYEQEVDYALKNLSDSIEPILLAFMGIMVLILALGVFLPMWNLSSVALAK